MKQNNKKIFRLISASLLLIAINLTPVFSQSGYELAKRLDEKKTPKDMSTDMTMVLTNSKGKTRSSTLRSVNMDGGEKQIIWFLAPADDKGVAFLKIEYKEKDDEMRLWLPAFKKIRRISTKKKGDAFMGSDMSYEDMTNRDLDDNNYEITGSELIGNVNYTILKSITKPDINSTYNYHLSWVNELDLTVLKEESYDRNNKLLKLKMLEHQSIKGYDVPTKIEVENVQKNHHTRLIFNKIEVDTGIKESLFQEKNLKRLPR